MTGLARLCKLYGRIDITDSSGKKVTWVWDYKNDKPVILKTKKKK